MDAGLEELEDRALALPGRARAELALRLIRSLDPDCLADEELKVPGPEPLEVSPEWSAEIARRVSEIDAGSADLTSASDAVTAIRLELGDARNAPP